MLHRIRQVLPIPDLTPTEVARFYGQLESSGCGVRWVGTDVNSQGYGRFAIYRQGKRVRVLAHRLAYKLATGVDPGSKVVRHGCDRPLCCTPGCLSLGTQVDNLRDAVEHGRFTRIIRQRDVAAQRRTTGEKSCSRCREVKPLSMFFRQSERLDGRQSRCKACVTDRKRRRASLARGGV